MSTGVRWMRSSLLSCLLLACASAVERAEPDRRFVFRNGFWVNLHHFLRAEVRRAERGAEPVLSPDELGPDERESWERALDVYRPLARRSLLFDEGMTRIRAALSAALDEEALPPGLEAELGAALEDAAPSFRARVWPARARDNDEWIRLTRPAVERVGRQVTDALAAAHQLAWPPEPILVDVTPETGANLAYTTNVAPPGFAGLATISPSVPGGSPAAIECVFHEAAHVLDATLVRWVEEESARQGVEPPSELWHAILFYTAGELTARALGEAGTYREDLTLGFSAFLPGLDACWKPYLDGSLPLAAALQGLVRAAASSRTGVGGR